MNNFNCVQSIIYINFVIEIKLLLNVKETNTEIKNAKNKIVKFYDQLFLSDDFKNVTKKDFKEMKRRYRNAHDVIKKKTMIFWKSVMYWSMSFFRNSRSVRERKWKISISTTIQRKKMIKEKNRMIKKRKKIIDRKRMIILRQMKKYNDEKCYCVRVLSAISLNDISKTMIFCCFSYYYSMYFDSII